MTKEKPFTKMVALAFGGALVLAGCAGQNGTKMGMADKAESAVAKAEKAVDKTRSQTSDWGLWKSTLKILGNAKSNLKKGNYEDAVDAAKTARFQAQKGLAQYREEQDQWKLAKQQAESNTDFDESAWVSGDAAKM
ncbi:MAG TPA: hypothetical protein VKA48_11710 [Gammaproteobacteria bacterium]|nr:hypothetical protein [Gammaproteobacteria bacterium]